MATAPIFDSAACFETDVDITDHLEAQKVAIGIESVLKDLGLHGFESAISPEYDRVRVQFASPADPAVAEKVVSLFSGVPLACLGQGHSSSSSWFDFGPASEDSLPSRAEDAAESLRNSGFIPTFRILPSAESQGCACSGDSDDRPTEQPIGHAVFLLDEDGDPIYSSTFLTRALAVDAISTQMKAEGIIDWGVYDAEGVLELFGAAADALDMEEGEGDGLLPPPAEDDSKRLDRLADIHEYEQELENLENDPIGMDELQQIQQDAFLRTLRKAA